jgi:hypothetical protein
MEVKTQAFSVSNTLDVPNNVEVKLISKPYMYWGKDNIEPNLYNKMFYESAYQSGIIRAKINYIVGSGFQVVEGDENSPILANEPSDYNLAEVMEDCTRDFELYNGFAMILHRNKGGQGGYVEHIDFDKLRYNEEMTMAYCSDDWGMSSQSEELTGFKEYPLYNPKENQPISLFVFIEKPKNTNNKKASKRVYYGIYPKPTYSGAIFSILSDIEIQKFHYFEAGNSFKGGTIINFANGEPDIDEKATFERNVKEALTPSENAGGILLTYSNGKDREVSVQALNGNDLDKRYLQTEKAVGQNIIIGHGATSGLLFGIKSEGQLGGSTELESAFNIFKKTYVRGRQKTIEQQYNYLFKNFFGSDLKIELNEPEPIYVSETDTENNTLTTLSTMSPLLATKVLNSMTTNEIRDLLPTLEPITGGDVISKPLSEGSPAEFSEQKDPIFEALKNVGVECSKLTFIEKKIIDREDFDFEKEEKELMSKYTKESFVSYSQLQKQIMQMILNGENFQGITEAIKGDLKEITKAYLDLKRKGIIGGKGELTTKGVKELSNNEPNFVLETRYTYEKRPDVDGDAVIDTTRDFCKMLIELDRAYTREEIEIISANEDRNVWLYRGGWYSDPKKPRPTAFCRHTWFQNITVKKL